MPSGLVVPPEASPLYAEAAVLVLVAVGLRTLLALMAADTEKAAPAIE